MSFAYVAAMFAAAPPAPTPKPATPAPVGGAAGALDFAPVSLNLPFILSFLGVILAVLMAVLAIRQGAGSGRGEVSKAANQSAVMGFSMFWYMMAAIGGVVLLGGFITWISKGSLGG